MAIIHDVMPVFELFQPTTVDDTVALLDKYETDAWVLAGGLDTFDWFKDRNKRRKVVVDLSGRPFLAYNLKIKQARVGNFDTELVHDFLLALTNQVGMNLHLNQVQGRNPHHIIEAGFKAFARALDKAKQVDPRVEGVPSTKGAL